MGHYTSIGHFGHTIQKFWPDDDENTVYLTSDTQHSLAGIIQMCREKWPDTDFNDLVFESDEIQTDCLGYNRYDPIDYTDFIIIRRVPRIDSDD